MANLKYTIIKNKKQYRTYCNNLELLIIKDDRTFKDEIELLTLLIEKWDAEHNSFNDLDPIEILKALMVESNLKAVDIVGILGLSKSTVSKILNYHKGLSKETIIKLSNYFKVSQETFNRPYALKNEINRHFSNARLMNTQKKIVTTSI